VLLFLILINQTTIQEGIVGTTKLTRKEILAEDPIHAAIIRIVDAFRSQGKIIAAAAGVAALLGAGVYFGIRYLENREVAAQQDLALGIEFFHGSVDPSAPDNPLQKGPVPLFKSDEAKYKAAMDSFNKVISTYGSSRLSVLARYYLGLSQLRLGQKDEAIRNLELVRNNTKDRTAGYLAKQVLASVYLDSGNPKEAISILEGMIKDPQCELPKEMLRLDLAKAYIASGNRAEVGKVLQQAKEDPKPSMLNSMVVTELEQLEKNAGGTSVTPPPPQP
jgi:predicted negative regulator of RcsB-dependent stress response